MDRSATYKKRLGAVCARRPGGESRSAVLSDLIPGASMASSHDDDDFASWLYQRIQATRVRRPASWDNLTSTERAYWRREAKAIRDRLRTSPVQEDPAR